jgi:hypothetical protein
MSQLIRQVKTRSGLLLQRHARVTWWVLFMCSLAAALTGLRFFTLDLDLGTLTRPVTDNTRHAQQMAYEAAFPQFQDAAIVVMSGDSPLEVDTAADTLLNAFRQSGWYSHAEAPGRDPFMVEHLLYQPSTAQLTRRVEQLQDLLPMLRQLDADPGLAGVLDLLRQLLLQDEANLGRSEATRDLLTTLQGALAKPGRPVDWLRGATPAAGDASYQLILLKGKRQLGEHTSSREVIVATRDTISEFASAYPGVSARLTGDLIMADEELQLALRGIRFAGGLSLLLLGLALAVGVRSWSITGLCVFTSSMAFLSFFPTEYPGLAMRDKTSEGVATLLELQREGISTQYAISVLSPAEYVLELSRQLEALPEVARVISPLDSIPVDQDRKSELLAPLAGFARLALTTPLPWDHSAADKARQQLLVALPAATSVYDLEDAAQLSAIASGLAALADESSLRALQGDLLDGLYRQLKELQKQVVAKPFTLADLPPATRARLIAPDGRHLLSVIPAQQLDNREAIDHFVVAVEAVAPNVVGRAVFEPLR